jgi:CMP-N,N'-diacetyllegionaminic acid synthase
MRNLAVIPARSGSKGLKDKNIKILNEKPLLVYTIEAAKQSGLFEEIFVSTDSEKYAKIALEWGANVPFMRRDELATDTTSSWEVVKNAIITYQEMGKEFETVALLQPTSPLRTAEDIIAGYNMMKEKDANIVVAVCEVDHSPLWSNILPQDLSFINFINQDLVNKPRQKLPTYYRVNGALYIAKTEYLMSANNNIYADKSFAFVMSKEHSVDIDDELDFVIAEALIKKSGI